MNEISQRIEKLLDSEDYLLAHMLASQGVSMNLPIDPRVMERVAEWRYSNRSSKNAN
jgi:hypothetical protein